MPMDAESPVLVRRGGDAAIAEIVLNRPGKRNALGVASWRALVNACAGLAADPAVRVAVVRGAPPAFSAGADIAEFGEVFRDAAAATAYNDLVQAALGAVERLEIPTIAMVAGDCVGGGCGLALACDLRFAAEGARFGITPARLGLAYTLADTRRLVDLVGPARAKDILFSARLLDAGEAHRSASSTACCPTTTGSRPPCATTPARWPPTLPTRCAPSSGRCS
jgi:enoyl-CoA hydratase/carnithine racemase